MGYKTNTASNYRHDTGYTHQAFCAAVWTWNVTVWETALGLLYEIMTGTRGIMTVDELVAALLSFEG